MDASRQKTLRSLLLGGLLPLVIYTFVEEYYGTLWGLVAGMVFGVGEIIHERVTQGKVDAITWIGNGMLVVLGGISLFTQEGFWFKMQPAILEAFMAALLVGSVLKGRPFLILLAEKQRLFDKLDPIRGALMRKQFTGLTVRIGVFFFLHSLLAAWAAVHWSTRAWVILKGVGFTLSLLVYMLIEVWFMRRKMMAPGVYPPPQP
jgi:intracellular septation protein